MSVSFVIETEAGEGYLFWSNKYGWGGIASATIFTAAQKKVTQLPFGGAWAQLP